MSPFNIAWSLLKRAEGYDDAPSASMPDPTMMADDWDEPTPWPPEEPAPKNVFPRGEEPDITTQSPEAYREAQRAEKDEQSPYKDADWQRVLEEMARDRARVATEGPVSPSPLHPHPDEFPPYQTQGAPAPRR